MNAHQFNHENMGTPDFKALHQKIHNMLFADRILEEEAVPHA